MPPGTDPKANSRSLPGLFLILMHVLDVALVQQQIRRAVPVHFQAAAVVPPLQWASTGRAPGARSRGLVRAIACPACGEVSKAPSCPACGAELLTRAVTKARFRRQRFDNFFPARAKALNGVVQPGFRPLTLGEVIARCPHVRPA